MNLRFSTRISGVVSAAIAKGIASIVVLLCVVAPASATTVTFDFTGGGGGSLGTTATFTDAASGLVLEATAQANLGLPDGGVAPSGYAAVLLNDSFGLSVGGTPQTDGGGGINSEQGEGILFSFLPSGWKLDSITFSKFDGSKNTDRAQIYEINGMGNVVGGQQLFGTSGTGTNDMATYTISGVVADPFGIAAIERLGRGNASNFRIASITVSQVPLPAAAWFMVTGLAGLIMIRRRRLVSG